MKKLTLLICCLLSFGLISAQHLRAPGQLAAQITQLQQRGATFNEVNDLLQTSGDLSTRPELRQELNEGLTFTLNSVTFSQLKNERPAQIRLNLPPLDGKQQKLLLSEWSPFTSDARVRTSSGLDFPAEQLGGQYYRGIIEGDDQSIVSLALIDNELMGMIASDAGTWSIAKLPENAARSANEHIFYADNSLKSGEGISCSTQDDGYVYSPEELADNYSAQKAGDCVRIYVEVDKDIHDNKGGVTQAANWTGGLFGQVGVIYSNENISTGVSEIFVWDSNSPYKGQNASNLLGAFQSERPNFNGDLAIMINLKNAGGIAASFSGICASNSANSMCYGGIFSSYSTVPNYSRSVYLCAHELGHLFGSRHTHACVWNGNGTAIDGCAGFTEGGCARPGLPSGGGTIMSYCDQTSVGVNFNRGFGSQPGNVIRGSVSSANCLGTSCSGTGGNTCNNGVQDGNETGVDCGGSCAPCSGSGSCDAPSGLSASKIKPTRANLNWSGVSGAGSYNVELRPVGASTWSQGSTSGTSVTATSLSNGTDYEWRVQSVCSGSTSSFSTTCSFTAGSSNSGGCGNALSYNFKVYPNPSQGTYSVFLPEAESDWTLTLMDGTGRIMGQFETTAGTHLRQETADLANGVYFLRAEALGQVPQTVRLMIQK